VCAGVHPLANGRGEFLNSLSSVRTTMAFRSVGKATLRSPFTVDTDDLFYGKAFDVLDRLLALRSMTSSGGSHRRCTKTGVPPPTGPAGRGPTASAARPLNMPTFPHNNDYRNGRRAAGRKELV
jgi:hypothetical protein